ncbi:hypothetical protein OAS14_00695 [Alphaproteobacteria bacterium]|nr:hypothetical protein [Alphaproteobacteria bacterium]
MEVIYLISSPLSERDFTRFGVQTWIARGWSVKVFDLSKYLVPNFFEYVDGHHSSVRFNGLKILDNKKSILSSLEALSNGNIFIDLLSDRTNFEYKLRKIAKRKGITVRLNVNTIPSAKFRYSSFFYKILNRLKRPQKMCYYFWRTVAGHRLLSPDYWVVSGTVSQEALQWSSSVIIKAHNLDYDFLLDSVCSVSDVTNGGLLFLDGDEVYHSDYVNLDVPVYATEEKYFAVMDIGLLEIGTALNCQVSVAAHPRSDYDKTPSKYSLPILKGQTFELVRHATVVVSHASTALLWAVALHKPIILVTTDEIESSSNAALRDTIVSFSHELGKTIFNLNHMPDDYDWMQELQVDHEKYDVCIEKYMKQPETSEKPFWDIVIDRMEKNLLTKT